jgi:FG-GAP-like repeat/FG-GAP repeat
VRFRWAAFFCVGILLAANGCGGGDDPTPAPQPGLIPLLTFSQMQLSDEFFAEGVAVGDINRDGAPDIIAGPFWYAGPNFQQRTAFRNPVAFDPLGSSDDFLTFTFDFNHDGWPDILIIGFPGSDATWFQNPQGGGGFWMSHTVFNGVGNESPAFTDLTGDGVPELVFQANGQLGWAGPNPADATLPWIFHALSPSLGSTPFFHGLGVGDVNGDGRRDVLASSGWWEQPASLSGDPQWVQHQVDFGNGAQIYVFDVDGDGDNDVVSSINAHGFGLAWFEQRNVGGQITFCRHLIMGDTPEQNRYGVKFSQPHALVVADMDGDGLPDIVTGKRRWAHGPSMDPEANFPPVLYWFRTVRSAQGVDFVPFLVDSNSGVGTQFVVSDMNGDGRPDILVSNKLGTFYRQQTAPTSGAPPQVLFPGVPSCT